MLVELEGLDFVFSVSLTGFLLLSDEIYGELILKNAG